MADRYQNFAQLNGTERSAIDFRICVRRQSATVAIIAPHGGRIEPGTSEIAAAIAGDSYNLYCFEGQKERRNRDLHITSARFDESQCLALVSSCDHVVAIHGCRGVRPIVFLGGLDFVLRDAIRSGLEAATFKTATHSDPALWGVDPKNICNRGRRRRGVQLEVSLAV